MLGVKRGLREERKVVFRGVTGMTMPQSMPIARTYSTCTTSSAAGSAAAERGVEASALRLKACQRRANSRRRGRLDGCAAGCAQSVHALRPSWGPSDTHSSWGGVLLS